MIRNSRHFNIQEVHQTNQGFNQQDIYINQIKEECEKTFIGEKYKQQFRKKIEQITSKLQYFQKSALNMCLPWKDVTFDENLNMFMIGTDNYFKKKFYLNGHAIGRVKLQEGKSISEEIEELITRIKQLENDFINWIDRNYKYKDNIISKQLELFLKLNTPENGQKIKNEAGNYLKKIMKLINIGNEEQIDQLESFQIVLEKYNLIFSTYSLNDIKQIEERFLNSIQLDQSNQFIQFNQIQQNQNIIIPYVIEQTLKISGKLDLISFFMFQNRFQYCNGECMNLYLTKFSTNNRGNRQQ